MRFRRSDPGQYTHCTNGHFQATCDSIVRSIPLDAIPSPVPATVRRSLVRYALMTGGPGAFDRLASAEGTISDRLAAVSRIPTDSLVRRWQQALVDSQSDEYRNRLRNWLRRLSSGQLHVRACAAELTMALNMWKWLVSFAAGCGLLWLWMFRGVSGPRRDPARPR